MQLSRRVEIRPTASQRRALLQHAGNARWAYNWGLRRKQEAYKVRKAALATGVPKEEAPKVPTAVDLHRELNALKKLPVEAGGVPWMYAASKCAPQEALRNLDEAFTHFFRRCREKAPKKGYPKFKSRKRGIGGFRLTGTVKVAQKEVTLPTIGRVRTMSGEAAYLPTGKHGEVAVTEKAGRWFVSVREQGESRPALPNGGPSVGLDMGVRKLAVLSDEVVFENRKALAGALRQLQRANRRVHRRQKGSANRGKARQRLAKVHYHVGNLRRDALHKASTAITKRYGRVVIEDLKIQNMTSKGRFKSGLNRVMLDASLGEFRRMLEYKGILYGCEIVVVHPAYTSQDCSCCGARNDCGSSEIYRCASSCGLVIDRDFNAARNILKAAASRSEAQNACGATVSRANPGWPARRVEAGIEMLS